MDETPNDPFASKREVAAHALVVNGLDQHDLTLFSNGLNSVYRSRDAIVKVSRSSPQEAGRQLEIARWVNDQGILAVEPLDVMQPIRRGRYVATLWRYVDNSRLSTPKELGHGINLLHQLTAPLHLYAPFDPLSNVRTVLQQSTFLRNNDRAFLIDLYDQSRGNLSNYLQNRNLSTLVHGDAWRGNYFIGSSGQGCWADFENSCFGPTEWDLVATAIEFADLGRFDQHSYREFCKSYGTDVLESAHFSLLATVFHLRWLSLLIRKVSLFSWASTELQWRIRCLRSEITRPWRWLPI